VDSIRGREQFCWSFLKEEFYTSSTANRAPITFVEFALGVGERKGTAVFDQLEETWGFVLGDDASGAAAEGVQLPGLAGLYGGAPGAGEAHSGEVCNKGFVKIWKRNGHASRGFCHILPNLHHNRKSLTSSGGKKLAVWRAPAALVPVLSEEIGTCGTTSARDCNSVHARADVISVKTN
jgi:hypothetical protein